MTNAPTHSPERRCSKAKSQGQAPKNQGAKTQPRIRKGVAIVSLNFQGQLSCYKWRYGCHSSEIEYVLFRRARSVCFLSSTCPGCILRLTRRGLLSRSWL